MEENLAKAFGENPPPTVDHTHPSHPHARPFPRLDRAHPRPRPRPRLGGALDDAHKLIATLTAERDRLLINLEGAAGKKGGLRLGK